MFALLALGGDIGCSGGPTLVGMVSGALGDDLKMGVLSFFVFQFDHQRRYLSGAAVSRNFSLRETEKSICLRAGAWQSEAGVPGNRNNGKLARGFTGRRKYGYRPQFCMRRPAQGKYAVSAAQGPQGGAGSGEGHFPV